MSQRPSIRIPRWIQLVGLPVLLLVGWALAGALGHAIFLFLTASVIAFLLNPLVRGLQGLRIRRGFAVAVVFLSFAAAMVVLIVALVTVVVEQTRSAADRVDAYLTDEPGRSGDSAFDRDVADLEAWLQDRGIDVQLRDQVDEWIADVNVSDLTQEAISVAGGAAFGFVQLVFSIILIVVIAVYMLLDMPKLEASIDRRFPPHGGDPLTLRIERALGSYVRGQVLLSTIIGASAGIGMWLLGVLDLVPGADEYALLFGLWTAVVEVIPYIGPWLSAVPPAIYALIVDPISVPLGGGALHLHLPGRGSRGRAERDGECAPAASAPRHLRPARGSGAVRDRRDPRRAARAGRRPGDLGVLRRAGDAGAVGRGCGRSGRGGGGAAQSGECPVGVMTPGA